MLKVKCTVIFAVQKTIWRRKEEKEEEGKKKKQKNEEEEKKNNNRKNVEEEEEEKQQHSECSIFHFTSSTSIWNKQCVYYV